MDAERKDGHANAAASAISFARRLWENVALAVLYITMARIGQLLAIPPGNITPVWLPSGIILAAVLLRGNHVWPGIFAGAFVGNVWAYWNSESATAIARCLFAGSANGLGDALGAVVGVWLIVRTTGGRDPFARAVNVVALIVFGAIVASAISALFGVTALCLTGFVPWPDYARSLLTWCTGDGVGVLMVTPVVLAWRQGVGGCRPRWEHLAFALTLAGVGWAIVHTRPYAASCTPLLLVLPLLMWAMFRFDQRVAFSAMFFIAAVAIIVTAVGKGPFSSTDNNDNLIDLQLFLLAVVAPMLVLRGALAESLQARGDLKALNCRLENRVRERTVALENELAERKRAEQALRDSEQKWRLLVQTIPDYVAVHDRQGGFIFLNHYAQGFSSQDIVGKCWRDFVAPESQAFFQRAFDDCLNSGKIQRFQYKALGHHGQWRHYDNFVVPLFDNGEVSRILSIARDITEQLQAEQQFRNEETKFRMVFDESPVGKSLTLPDGRLSRVNRAFADMLGYTLQEMTGVNFVQITHPDDVAESRECIRALLNREQDIYHLCKRYIHKHGHIVWAEITTRMHRDEYGVAQFLLTHIQDISERKLTEERMQRLNADLVRSNKELEQFAYVASHDLQEPLRMVASYTQLLAKRYQDRLDQDANEFIHYAVDGANRMQRLIQDLLAYSRVNTRGSTLARVDLHAALADAVANLQVAIHESSALVTNGELPTVTGDRLLLAQLLQNLLANAIKFRQKEVPPRVHVSAEKSGDEWVVSVQDNGIGIDPQYFGRLFVIFQRLHSRQEYPGTGIGLAICQRIVARHGGKIWVESAPGQGAAFRFTLRSEWTTYGRDTRDQLPERRPQ